MVRWTTLSIAACWLLAASLGPARVPAPAAMPEAAAMPAWSGGDCLTCHPSARGMLVSPMVARHAERAFAHRALGAEGEQFFAASCSGCHVSGCQDCHGDAPHAAGRPQDAACLRCHQGGFVGEEYHGRAPREDHHRYRRGPVAGGQPFLKMLPDVHREHGLLCADCHTMRSLQEGRPSAKGCRDCHPEPSPDVPEHALTAHLEKMECYACHSAWAPQEYGTFLVNASTEEQQDAYSWLPAWGPWRRSAYLRRQDAPPLGLNARGKVSPIRPQLVLFATDLERGWENRLLAAEWKAFFPHTVRRGTVTCSGCHDSPRRFLLEDDRARLHLLDADGLALRSFWSREGQVVANGSFFPPERHSEMNRKTPGYVRAYLKQWQNLLEHADPR